MGEATPTHCEVLSVVLLRKGHDFEVVELRASITIAEEVLHAFLAHDELVEVQWSRGQTLGLQEHSRVNLLAFLLNRSFLLWDRPTLVHLHDRQGLVCDCSYCPSFHCLLCYSDVLSNRLVKRNLVHSQRRDDPVALDSWKG